MTFKKIEVGSREVTKSVQLLYAPAAKILVQLSTFVTYL